MSIEKKIDDKDTFLIGIPASRKTNYFIYLKKKGVPGRLYQHNLNENDFFELEIFGQGGDCFTTNVTYVALTLPKSKTIAYVSIYPDGGVGWKDGDHTKILREINLNDRMLILSFCRYTAKAIIMDSHTEVRDQQWYLTNLADTFADGKHVLKRIKLGPSGGRKLIRTQYEQAASYGIFEQVHLI